MTHRRLRHAGAVGAIAFLFFLGKGLLWLALGAVAFYTMP